MLLNQVNNYYEDDIEMKLKFFFFVSCSKMVIFYECKDKKKKY